MRTFACSRTKKEDIEKQGISTDRWRKSAKMEWSCWAVRIEQFYVRFMAAYDASSQKGCGSNWSSFRFFLLLLHCFCFHFHLHYADRILQLKNEKLSYSPPLPSPPKNEASNWKLISILYHLGHKCKNSGCISWFID